MKEMFGRKRQKEKVSEMIMKYAGDYIALGDDIEHKQQLLNSAVSAWNVACIDESERQSAIKKYMRKYRKLNPTHTKLILKDVEKDLKLLIKEKMRLYPDKKIQIINAQINEIDGKHHITAMSINKGASV